MARTQQDLDNFMNNMQEDTFYISPFTYLERDMPYRTSPEQYVWWFTFYPNPVDEGDEDTQIHIAPNFLSYYFENGRRGFPLFPDKLSRKEVGTIEEAYAFQDRCFAELYKDIERRKKHIDYEYKNRYDTSDYE